MEEKDNTINLDNSTILEYIKIQWQDIHHSRLQEYTVFGLVAAVFYALSKTGDVNKELQPLVIWVGFFFSIIGLIISWKHNEIFKQKIQVIGELERKIGIVYPSQSKVLSVQILIVWLFGGIMSVFIGIIVSKVIKVEVEVEGINIIPLLAAILSCITLVILSTRQKTSEIKYDNPFFIENDDIVKCLNSLNGAPLKLVVDDLFSRKKIKEVTWVEPKWEFTTQNDSIIKPVFVTPKDIFQFSVADESSEQDWHFHKFVFEIYLSEKPITLEYKDPSLNVISKVVVQKGALVVPPRLEHKVTLEGLTFVFQATIAKNRRIRNDKTKVRTPKSVSS